jgi:cytochrome c biogenesis protein
MTARETKETPDVKKQGVLQSIASFFTSVRTTITILFLLAGTSIIGTVIPQTQTLEQLRQTSHPFVFRLIVILDLHSLFQSWWFQALLILLALNLLGCLIQRVPRIASEWNPVLRKVAFNKTLSDPRSLNELEGLVTAAVRPILGGKPRESRMEDGVSLYWIKHRIHLLGFPFIHIGIIVILLGGLIGLLYGFKGSVTIMEGGKEKQFFETRAGGIRPLPFTIAVDKFTLNRYPTGEPKEFRSDIRILDNGAELFKGSIRVNHPVTIKDLSLYQASYELRGIKDVRLEVKSGDGQAKELVVQPNESAKVPGTNIKISLLSLGQKSQGREEGLELAVEGPDESARRLMLYKNDPVPVKLGSSELRFLSYLPLYSTGLQIGYDPGTSVVWAGCILLISGFCLTLFTNHRRLKVELNASDGRSEIKISGRSRRLRREFRESVEKAIQDGLGGSGPGSS